MNTALLVIDMQNDHFLAGRLKDHEETLVKNINQLVDEAHKKNVPVIWIRQEFNDDLSDAPLYNKKNNKLSTIKGTYGAKLLDGLHKEVGDKEVIKKRFSSFFNTNLDDLLKKIGADTLIITGVNTMSCVRVTTIDAYQRDYEVILAIDCVDGHDVEQHENSLKYLQFSVSQGKTNKEIIESM